MASKDKAIDALSVYFKELQEIAKWMDKQQEVLQKLQKSLQPIIEAWKTSQKALEPILASIQGSISPAFEQLQRSFRELPPRTQEVLLLLGDHGWYLDLEMPLPVLWELGKALSEGNVKEAECALECALIEYFESRIDEIEESIAKRFPKRKNLIRAAFNAHRRQEYELSIPVLLAQTDGICKEVVNEYFFIKKNKKPRTAIYVEQIASDTYMAALLSPLARTLPIGASEHERRGGFNELNRHMVLHGESLDYGTKTNSLKAISLVNYVAHVLTLEDKNP